MVVLAVLLNGQAAAQGDGPHNLPLIPKDTNLFVMVPMGRSGNFNPSQTVLIPGASMDVFALPITYIRTFSLGGRVGRLFLTAPLATMDAGGQHSCRRVTRHTCRRFGPARACCLYLPVATAWHRDPPDAINRGTRVSAAVRQVTLLLTIVRGIVPVSVRGSAHDLRRRSAAAKQRGSARRARTRSTGRPAIAHPARPRASPPLPPTLTAPAWGTPR